MRRVHLAGIVDKNSGTSWQVHPLDLALWLRVIPLAWEVACAHRLPLTEVRPTPTPGPYNRQSQKVTGCCYTREGIIHLVLRHRNPETGEWMPAARPEADVFHTLAHELAHLEEARHSPRFYALLHTLLRDVTSRRRV